MQALNSFVDSSKAFRKIGNWTLKVSFEVGRDLGTASSDGLTVMLCAGLFKNA
jgi:hypothetical protein